MRLLSASLLVGLWALLFVGVQAYDRELCGGGSYTAPNTTLTCQ
jgi:hypothetical protein